MGELQASMDIFPIWKAVIWCFYPVLALIVIDIVTRGFDDDDDQGGGMMIPAYQGVKS